MQGGSQIKIPHDVLRRLLGLSVTGMLGKVVRQFAKQVGELLGGDAVKAANLQLS